MKFVRDIWSDFHAASNIIAVKLYTSCDGLTALQCWLNKAANDQECITISVHKTPEEAVKALIHLVEELESTK